MIYDGDDDYDSDKNIASSSIVTLFLFMMVLVFVVPALVCVPIAIVIYLVSVGAMSKSRLTLLNIAAILTVSFVTSMIGVVHRCATTHRDGNNASVTRQFVRKVDRLNSGIVARSDVETGGTKATAVA